MIENTTKSAKILMTFTVNVFDFYKAEKIKYC